MKRLRICLIGASHVSTFMLGWRHIADAFPGVSVNALVSGGDFYRDFVADKPNNCLKVNNENKNRRIYGALGGDGSFFLHQYDLIIVAGGINWWRGVDRRLYSRQVVDAALCRHMETSLAFPLLKAIREISEIDVKLTHAPFPASRAPALPTYFTGYNEDIKLANQLVFTPMNMELLAQPDETVTSGIQLSNIEYAVGYRAQGVGAVEGEAPVILDDLNHMNSAFGTLVMLNILAEIGLQPNSKFSGIPEANGHLPFAQKFEDGPK